MRISWLARMEPGEFVLRGAGVTLAAGSLVFAAQELSGSSNEPHIAGVEHLAIYAKPSKRAAQPPQRAFEHGVDYTPIGSTQDRSRGALLDSYEILDVSRDSALIRLPEGRVQRVGPGGRIAGLGAVLSIRQSSQKWRIVTQSGVIRQN